MSVRPPNRIVANACVLCGNASARLTDEHVISDWLSGLYPEMTESYYAIGGDPTDEPRATWKGKPFDLRVKVLCASCNNAWLSKRERAIKPLPAPMILGTSSRSLRPIHQHSLAFWAVKMALMADHISPRPRVIPEGEYRAFRFIEHPLDTHAVWIASRPAPLNVGGSPIATIMKQSISFPDASAPLMSEWRARGLAAYRITIGIGCVLFQLFGHNFPVALDIEVPDDAPVRRIWPQSRRFRWPTPPGFGRDSGPSELHQKFDPLPEVGVPASPDET